MVLIKKILYEAGNFGYLKTIISIYFLSFIFKYFIRITILIHLFAYIKIFILFLTRTKTFILKNKLSHHYILKNVYIIKSKKNKDFMISIFMNYLIILFLNYSAKSILLSIELGKKIYISWLTTDSLVFFPNLKKIIIKEVYLDNIDNVETDISFLNITIKIKSK
jgi:hypothetical protein